nr:thioesterase domain-containing protein [Streptomyces leeuwenhoekii]
MDCPVTVRTGDSDPGVPVDEAAAWEEHTTGPAELHVLPGGHFFLVQQSAGVIELLERELADPPHGVAL